MGCGSSSIPKEDLKANPAASPNKADVESGSKSPATSKKKVDGRKRVSFEEETPRVVSSRETLEAVREIRTLSQNVVQENFDRDIRDFYNVSWKSELGCGVNGSVRICKHKTTGIAYAMKTLSKKFIRPDKYAGLKDEIKIMQDIDHPHILRIFEYFETPDHIYLISELCTGGELYTRLTSQTDSMYSEQVACRYVSIMLSAIAYLHAHGIVHRDLKLENFLFETEKENSSLKLIDFGLSRSIQADEKLTGAVGSSYYVAPEVLTGKQYDAKCDIWSIGVITYMLLSGVPPFDGDCDREIFKSVRSGRWSFTPTFENISPEAKAFVQGCLVSDPVKRMSAKEAIKHPWFKLLTFTQTSKNVSPNVVSKIFDFSKRNKLTKLFLEVMAYTMQPSQLEDIKKQFVKLDVSKTGMISFNDLKTAIGSYVDPSKIEALFNEIDYSNTGFINYHEFIAAVLSNSVIKEENMKLAFEMISNHNDYFTGQDISNILGAQSSQKEVDSILASAKLNKSQRIHFQTFKNLLELTTPESGHSGASATAPAAHPTGPTKSASQISNFSADLSPTKPTTAAAQNNSHNNGNKLRRNNSNSHLDIVLSTDANDSPARSKRHVDQPKQSQSQALAVDVSFNKSPSARSVSTQPETPYHSPSEEDILRPADAQAASAQTNVAQESDWLGISFITAPIIGIASYLPSFGTSAE